MHMGLACRPWPEIEVRRGCGGAVWSHTFAGDSLLAQHANLAAIGHSGQNSGAG
jgi:hypothetical protein